MNFSLRYVAFLDVLGFKTMIKSDSGHQSAGIIFSCINEAFGSIKPVKGGIFPATAMNYSVMSDSIVLSIAEPDEWTEKVKTIRYLLRAVQRIQLKCASSDIWFSGAVSHGDLFHEDNVVGVGLVRAYELSTTHSCPPRVIVDAATMKRVFQNAPPDIESITDYIEQVNRCYSEEEYGDGVFLFPTTSHRDTLKIEDDYPYFVHYLYEAAKQPNDLWEILGYVNENLRNPANPRVYSKFRWVKNYLKSFIPETRWNERIRKRMTSD